MHFGIDLAAPCGTPVVAIADGIVEHVDNFEFGIRPHNLVITHAELGYRSLYGHLLSKPAMTRGQPVKRGQVVAQTGDPDLTCVSRPHLHLEIRSMDYHTAYNPAALIDADWPMMMTMGSGSATFSKDLYNPNRWQTIDSQPEIRFGGPRLNDYRASWPLTGRFSPSAQTLPAFVAPPIADSVTFHQLTQPGCCSQAWWASDGKSIRYFDGPEGQLANVWSVGAEGGTSQVVEGNIYKRASPNGQYEVGWDNEQVAVLRRSDGTVWPIDTGGAFPRFSPGSLRLLWVRTSGDSVPGGTPPRSEIWVSNHDGSNPQRIVQQQGGSATWLDDDRLLISRREPNSNISTLSVYTLSTGQTKLLLSAAGLRGLSISPGGRHILYYLTFQPNPATNGMYVIDTLTNTSAIKLPFFGSWRWRDSMNIVYIPYEVGQPMRYVVFDIISGQQRQLTNPETQPFVVANDDWSIAPNGQYIVLWNARDLALWSIKLAP